MGETPGLPGEVADEGRGDGEARSARPPASAAAAAAARSAGRRGSSRRVLKVWARPKKAIPTRAQEAKSSPEGTLKLISRPTDSSIISTKIATRLMPADIAGDRDRARIEEAADHARALDDARSHQAARPCARRRLPGPVPSCRILPIGPAWPLSHVPIAQSSIVAGEMGLSTFHRRFIDETSKWLRLGQ
jgi:hypothetical protein